MAHSAIFVLLAATLLACGVAGEQQGSAVAARAIHAGALDASGALAVKKVDHTSSSSSSLTAHHAGLAAVAVRGGSSTSSKAVMATKAKAKIAFLAASVITGIVLTVAKICVKLYSYYLTAKFKAFLLVLTKEVQDTVEAVVEKFRTTLEKVETAQTKLMNLLKNSNVPEMKEFEKKYQETSELMKNAIEKAGIGVNDLATTATAAKKKALIQFGKDILATGAQGVLGYSLIAGGNVGDQLKANAMDLAKDGTTKLFEEVAIKVGKEVGKAAMKNVLAAFGVVASVIELGVLVKGTLTKSAYLKHLKKTYKEEAKEGPSKHMRWRVCKIFQSMYESIGRQLKELSPKLRGSDKEIRKAMGDVLKPIEGASSDRTLLNCEEFYGQPPSKSKPICSIFAPGKFGVQTKTQKVAGWGIFGSDDKRAAAAHIQKLKDPFYSKNRWFQIPQLGLGIQKINAQLENSKFRTPPPECSEPITALEVVYGKNINQKNSGWFSTSYTSISSVGHFGMRTFLPVLISAASTKFMWEKMKEYDDKGLDEFDNAKVEVKLPKATYVNNMLRRYSPFNTSTVHVGVRPFLEPYNFYRNRMDREVDPTEGQTNGKDKAQDSDDQLYLLYTHATGAPVTHVKLCRDVPNFLPFYPNGFSSFNNCTRRYGSNMLPEYEMCGWRKIPPILMDKAQIQPEDLPEYCFRVDWHVDRLKPIDFKLPYTGPADALWKICDSKSAPNMAKATELVNAGIDVNYEGRGGWTTLHMTARDGRTEVIKLLLTEGNAEVDKANNDGCTPLYVAAQEGKTEVVKLLVTEGKADVDKTNNDGTTPLFIAAQNGNAGVVKLLLRGGADKNIAWQGKYTPLMAAKGKGHQAIVALLQ